MYNFNKPINFPKLETFYEKFFFKFWPKSIGRYIISVYTKTLEPKSFSKRGNKKKDIHHSCDCARPYGLYDLSGKTVYEQQKNVSLKYFYKDLAICTGCYSLLPALFITIKYNYK